MYNSALLVKSYFFFYGCSIYHYNALTITLYLYFTTSFDKTNQKKSYPKCKYQPVSPALGNAFDL